MVHVIDASVAIKWFVEEPDRDKSLAILEQILSTPSRFAVPELFFFELIHVFHRAIPHPQGVQLNLLAGVLNLGWERFAMTPSWMSEMREFQRMGMSGYDAAYVALAKTVGGKWITCDGRAHALVARLGLSVLL